MNNVRQFPERRIMAGHVEQVPKILTPAEVAGIRLKVAGVSSSVIVPLPLCARDRVSEYLVEEIERGKNDAKIGLFKVFVCGWLEERLKDEKAVYSLADIRAMVHAGIAYIKRTEYPVLERHRLPSDQCIRKIAAELNQVIDEQVDKTSGRSRKPAL